MKLYFYRRTRYPSTEQPEYYNISQGVAGFSEKRPDEPAMYEGTMDEFIGHLDDEHPRVARRMNRRKHLPLK